MEDSVSKQKHVVIGLDFGTTWSCIAWTEVGDLEKDENERIKVITEWPSGSNQLAVPSEIAYRTSKGFGRATKRDHRGKPIIDFEWGHNINLGSPRLSFLKLLLEPRRYPDVLPKDLADVEALTSQLKIAKREAGEAISDFLSRIYTHAKEQIQQDVCPPYDSIKFTHVMTVPAAWSESAKEATYKAAQQAGIGPELHFISEPEAAGYYTLASRHGRSDLRQGDLCIICDAGGGTIDVLTHEVVELSPLRIKEAISGDGDFGGGVYIDQAFERLVRDKLGPVEMAELEKDPRIMPYLVQQFRERVKAEFDPKDTEKSYNIFMLGRSDIILQYSEMEELFKPQVEKALTLIERQMQKLASFKKQASIVLLVGGFGSSKSLRNAIESKFPTVTVRGSNHGGTAVARGAVLAVTQGSFPIVSRKARHHLGVICRTTFDPQKHALHVKAVDRFEGPEVREQLQWFVNKDDDLLSDIAIRRPYYETFPLKGRLPSSYKIDFVISDEEDAPTTFEESPITRRLCTLDVNLGPLKEKTLLASTGKWRRLDFFLGVRYSGRLIFELTHENEFVDLVTADYADIGDSRDDARTNNMTGNSIVPARSITANVTHTTTEMDLDIVTAPGFLDYVGPEVTPNNRTVAVTQLVSDGRRNDRTVPVAEPPSETLAENRDPSTLSTIHGDPPSSSRPRRAAAPYTYAAASSPK